MTTKSRTRKPPQSSNSEALSVLNELGKNVRHLRDRRGITRKALALATGVSERHLANLEYGEGNASILVLQQVAQALDCSIAELVGDFTTRSPELLMIRSQLEGRDETTLRNIRIAIANELGTSADTTDKKTKIALIGLRGAGKTTLGKLLAQSLGYPFVEISREIEKFAGCTIAEIQDLYGANAYRRYERRALEETIQLYPEVVVGTPGGLVSDPVNFELLLNHCSTVWLEARPEDHMQRVVDQGDLRPIESSSEAMEDLRGILESREEFYSKAQCRLNTSLDSLDKTHYALLSLVESTF